MNISNSTSPSQRYYTEKESWQLGQNDFKRLEAHVEKQEAKIADLRKKKESVKSQLIKVAIPLDFDIYGLGRRAYLIWKLEQIRRQMERAQMYLKGFHDIIKRQKLCLII